MTTVVETEATMVERIRAHHRGDPRMSPEWVVLDQVASKAGYNPRHADAIAINLWESRGLAVHGFEVKVNRSDWQRELRDPAKADTFIRYCDFWWMAAPDGVVLPAELPDGWGLMVPNRGEKLKVVHRAVKREPEPWTRGLFIGLLRRAVGQGASKGEIATAVAAAIAMARRDMAAENKRLQSDVTTLERLVNEFNSGFTGKPVSRYLYGPLSRHSSSAPARARQLGEEAAKFETMDAPALRQEAVAAASALRQQALRILNATYAILGEAEDEADGEW